MKRFRAAIIAACLAVTVLFAAAPVAHAAPPRLPDSADCSIVVTYDWSGVAVESGGSGTLRSQTALQDTKSSDGTYCYTRALAKVWTTTGTVSVNQRNVYQHIAGGGTVPGSEYFSSATVTIGTAAQYIYAPWKDPCASVIGSSWIYQSGGSGYVHSQTYPPEYRC